MAIHNGNRSGIYNFQEVSFRAEHTKQSIYEPFFHLQTRTKNII